MKSRRKYMDNNFKNPIMKGADPFVLFYEGKYYMYSTTESARTLVGANDFATDTPEGDGIFVYVSNDLKCWEKHGYALKKGDSIGEKWFWAPEVLEYRGEFYMVYAADEHIAIAKASHPLGPFKQENKRWLRDGMAIDGSFLVDDDGTVYLYYARLGGGNRIFVAKMKDDLSGIEEEYENCLIEAEAPWETLDCLIAEGPFAIKHKGLYYLTYSCNHTRCVDYAVGYAVSKSPLGPFERFYGNPILKRNGNLIGVGHHSFFHAEDGTLLCAYHCHSIGTENFKPRLSCINTAEFVEDENGIDKLVINGPK
jgi:beta-xylosidase